MMRVNPHPSQLAFLRTCLSSTDPLLRAKSIAVITTHLGAQVVDFLQPLLANSDVETRRAIVVALGQIRSASVIQILLHQAEIDPETHQDAIRALVALGDISAAPRLIAMLERESGSARLPIVEALSHLADPAAEPALIRLLADEDGSVRRAAVRALGNFHSRVAIRHIVAVCRDADPSVRLAVAETLALQNDAQAREALERMVADVDQAVAAFARRHVK